METNVGLNNRFILKAFLILFLIYVNAFNIVYIFIFNVTNLSAALTVLPATKDLFLLFTFFVVMIFFLSQRRITIKKELFPIYVVIGLYVFTLIISFAMSNAPMSYKVYNLRQLTILLIAFLTFLHWPALPNDLSLFKKYLSFVALLVIGFGLIEYILPASFWDNIIGLKKYAASRFLGETEVERNYSSDLIFLIGRKVRRMMSFFAEPVTFGSYVSCMFTYLSFVKDFPYRRILLPALLICGVLIFSKIFIATVFLVFGYKYIVRKPKLYPLVIFTICLYLIGSFTYDTFGKVHGSLSHLFGYYTGINLLIESPFGFGLGMAGNRGVLDHDIGMGEFGGESGLGNLTAQLGIPGLSFFLFMLLSLFALKRRWLKTNHQDYFAVYVALIAYIINFYLSAASLGMSGNIMFFVILGFYLNPLVNVNKEG